MTIVPQCFDCRHFRGKAHGRAAGYTCAAFPEQPGIPRPILYNEFDHKKPYPGDHGIRFEPRPGEQD